MTEKLGTEANRHPVARAHLPIVCLVAAAWGIGIARGVITNPALHASAAAVIAVSLVLLATELISFPEPYDPDLEKRLSRQVVLERS